MKKPAQKGLRHLAQQIEKLVRNHPAASQAQPIVVVMLDHLNALARLEELNRMAAKLEALNRG